MWRLLPFHPWQRNLPPTEQQATVASPEVYFLGATLGTCPLVVLGNAGPEATGVADHAAWLAHAGIRHGAVSINLPTAAAFEAQLAALKADPSKAPADEDLSYLTQQCHAVARALDLLGVGWVHVVGHSVGALVAAKMAWLYPEKIGTITLLDTPLLTKQQVRNEERRADLIRASLDVNTPAQLLHDAKMTLRKEREPILPAPPMTSAGAGAVTQNSIDIYARHIFPEAQLFADGGVYRDDSPFFLSAAHIEQIRVPVQLISPKANALADASLHKAKLNLRKHQVIAAAESHAAIFADGKNGGAGEVGAAVAQWFDRFDMDAMMKRKWEQSIRDIRPRKAAEGAAAGDDASKAEGGKTEGGAGAKQQGGGKRPPGQQQQQQGKKNKQK